MPQPPKRKSRKKKRRKRKRYLGGILHAGNAIVLCCCVGFVLGLIFGVALGFIMKSHTGFEVGVNLFAGMLGGTAIGGGVGYLLAGILPGASADASEQLSRGLYPVIGGFILVGIGIVSFGAYSGMERGGRPKTGFKVAIALYDIFGSWGMLIILGGAGLAMIAFGVRAMLPRDS